MDKETTYTSINELPLCLSVADISNVLGIGITYAYQIVKSEDFPKLTIGKRIIIPKEAFINWLQEHTKTTV